MKLTGFRVTDFRSVSDSGWIEVDDISALIGVNESGKTNLLLPLWKLNPAYDGEIEPTSDYPKTMFGEIRESPSDYKFIEAEFSLGEKAAAAIAEQAGIPSAHTRIVRICRYYDGSYEIDFPSHRISRKIPGSNIIREIESVAKNISTAKALKQEHELQANLTQSLQSLSSGICSSDNITSYQIRDIILKVKKLIPESPAKTSAIVPLLHQLKTTLNQKLSHITAPNPGSKEEVVTLLKSMMPRFVYYSNYGNLDSEIYLPHVVENLGRDDLGSKESAKVRTLKVLFKFVRLQAKEILELGQDFKSPDGRRPSQEEIADIAEKKKTRSILLQSAGSTLTSRFREWWKQGDYRFRFEADGNHFRIWVADDRRPTEVELENRSSGLQWFLSFYLVFLVESGEAHANSILLLDEPGVSLHPLAQRDLSAFFENLSKSNQILYTSHSPFLVDADRLERARKVYVDAEGTTKATADLRFAEGKDEQAGAAYAVHSALNLSVAESLLLGCQPILVEGPSDQHYLTAIKSLLVSGGEITPSRELVFPPCGGAKTAKVVASILTGRDESLPVVLLDSDHIGEQMAKALKQNLYASANGLVLSVGDFVGIDNGEIEDLMPHSFLAEELDRMQRDSDTRLEDVLQAGKPFVPQVEQWAASQSLVLPPHWKVTLATRIKQRALIKGIGYFDRDVVDRWVALFNQFKLDPKA
jgi:AAA15 family ATPase/GTPase/5S rRNA maturation endonuclease (ribonuclease M5)